MPGDATARHGIRFDAQRLLAAMALYEQALTVHRDELDSLNVFPVPDGDTGTNLLFTQRAVTAAIRVPEPTDEDELSVALDAVSNAALRAARGNSGVILAAVLEAFVGSLGAADGSAAGVALAFAFAAADRAARRAVVDPKEGTVLTVLRAAASGASRATAAAGTEDDACAAARAALASANEALAETRHQLPELARAGVVDAGALGLLLLVDCVRAALVGDEPGIPIGPHGPVGRPAAGRQDAVDGGAFEVQFVVHADEASIERLRHELAAVGTSLAISGSAGTYAVHVHTDDPSRALGAGATAGRVEDRAVRPFDARPDPKRAGDGSASSPAVRIGLVAIAEGAGLETLFTSLGAAVVTGGPGHDPSVAALQTALDAGGLEGSVLVPNHPNVVTAAREAAGASGRPAAVVDARSIPAGLAAAAAYMPDAALSENLAEMSAAAAAVRAGEVGLAAVDIDTGAGTVHEGDWFAAIGDTIVDIGGQPAPLALRLVELLVGEVVDTELITVVLGDGAPSPENDLIFQALRDAWPDLRIDVIVGGQPHPRYLIGVE